MSHIKLSDTQLYILQQLDQGYVYRVLDKVRGGEMHYITDKCGKTETVKKSSFNPLYNAALIELKEQVNEYVWDYTLSDLGKEYLRDGRG